MNFSLAVLCKSFSFYIIYFYIEWPITVPGSKVIACQMKVKPPKFFLVFCEVIRMCYNTCFHSFLKGVRNKTLLNSVPSAELCYSLVCTLPLCSEEVRRKVLQVSFLPEDLEEG